MKKYYDTPALKAEFIYSADIITESPQGLGAINDDVVDASAL